jgi:ketosteroid isomerase-like protein
VRHAATIACAIALAACPRAKPKDATPIAPATPREVVAAVRGAVEQWRQAYEARTFDVLAKLYRHDLEVVVVHDGAALIGWTSVEAMLRDRLARAKQIHVRLKDVQVTSLDDTVAFAIATMTREISDGVTTVTEDGAVTLVLRRECDPEQKAEGACPTRWVIVGEHYSYKRRG